MLFGDRESAAEVLKTRNPKVQKEIGRGVKGYVDAEWNAVREQIVFNILVDKFTQNESMLVTLMSTGKTTIVEASPYDKIWGIGLAEDDPRALDPAQWQGLNLLGKILTELMAKTSSNCTNNRKRVRVVYGLGLENRRSFMGTVSSNLTASAAA